MDYKAFKGTLLKSIIIVGVLGAIVALMGVGTILYMLTSPESSVIGLSLFGGLFILLGGFFLYKSGPAIIRILTDTYPVLKGIKDGERDAILWLYQIPASLSWPATACSARRMRRALPPPRGSGAPLSEREVHGRRALHQGGKPIGCVEVDPCRLPRDPPAAGYDPGRGDASRTLDGDDGAVGIEAIRNPECRPHPVAAGVSIACRCLHRDFDHAELRGDVHEPSRHDQSTAVRVEQFDALGWWPH